MSETTIPLPDLMTPQALALEWEVKEKTLANWRSQRVGPPFVKISGGVVRYSRQAVTTWLESQQQDRVTRSA